MMKKGVMVYHQESRQWQIWVEHYGFWVNERDTFEMKIQQDYYYAEVFQVSEWKITLAGRIDFNLYKGEIYPVRITHENYEPVCTDECDCD
jgi:hypothetical protein